MFKHVLIVEEHGEEDNMLKKLLSFHFFDLGGIILGASLITSLKPMDLFNVIISPSLYVMVFIFSFAWHIFMWLFAYRFEKTYMKRTIFSIIRDFFRITLACISVIGIYFLSKFLV